MAEKPDSDVERALEAFGGGALKYHSFGRFEPRQGHADVPPALVPDDDSEYDPFAVASPPPLPLPRPVMPAPQQPGAETIYPLLGAAMSETSRVSMAPEGSTARYGASAPMPAPRVEPEEPFDVHEAPESFPMLSRRTRGPDTYVPPPSPDAAPPAAFAPAPVVHSPFAPEAFTPASSRWGSVSTPVAERGWVPPPPVSEPPPPPRVAMPEPPPPPPPARVAPPPPPPPVAPAPPPPPMPPAPMPPATAPMMAQVVEAPVAPPVRPAPPPAAPVAVPVTLAPHLDARQRPVAPAPVPEPPAAPVREVAKESPPVEGPLMSPPTVAKADHRPLAEMFAILTTDPEPEPEPELPPEPEPEPEPEAVAVAEHEAEAVAPSEPELHDDAGLFRRL